MTGDLMREVRAKGAADGRAASSRIDRVESRVKAQDALLVKAFGPDELRNRLGAEVALDMLANAGVDTTGIRARWDAERQRVESTTRQVSTVYDSLDNDPRHDVRVTDAIMRGAGEAELRKIIGQVTSEYAQRVKREAAEASRRTNYMWTDQNGRARYGDAAPVSLGAATDPFTGNPTQKTLAVNRAVPPLGSEPVGEVSMSDVRTVATVCSEHPGQPGDRYCSVCGRPRP